MMAPTFVPALGERRVECYLLAQ
ncbi:hypothetical protein AGR4C_Cc30015 [Agrobacterium tumefaciens str. Kerr 14]|uniref:Uncharacterized protein n=1 Tax=Agrobacterium tumefaciens str. Kerr 14 TaxID=1183424 RepID=A0A1S7PRF6_AGRTU|nr:hypothetical protein AGR4C_Cc30015 [Agrobacterium tumefaciens str. Kerr 14]